MKSKIVLISTLVFSVIGLAISIYSFLHNQGFASGEFCTLGDTINCDIVNKGPFSQIAGVPVAFIGVIGYLFLVITSWMKARRPLDKSLTTFLLLSSSVGFLFSVYLTSLEIFVLHAWCVLCVTSQLLIFVIVSLCVFLSMEQRGK